LLKKKGITYLTLKCVLKSCALDSVRSFCCWRAIMQQSRKNCLCI